MPGTATISWINAIHLNGFYRSITLDQPSSDLTDFPVLFSGTFTYLKTEANGGNVKNSNGYDIVFYSNSSLTSKLKFERVFWDAATGTVEFWVKVPTLTSASALVIYIAYGNPLITTDQQDAVNVWDTNYQAVYHIADGTTLALTDSTSKGNTLTNNGATAASGKIDGAASFGGTNDLHITSAPAAMQVNDYTYSAWVNPNSVTGVQSFVEIGDSSVADQLLAINGAGLLGVSYYSGLNNLINGTTSLSTGTWYYVTFVRDTVANQIRIYRNGSSDATPVSLTSSTANYGTTKGVYIGARGSIQRFNGFIDEIRISSSARTADWIATEYSNQNDPANFYVIGNETPV